MHTSLYTATQVRENLQLPNQIQRISYNNGVNLWNENFFVLQTNTEESNYKMRLKYKTRTDNKCFKNVWMFKYNKEHKGIQSFLHIHNDLLASVRPMI
jgi:hypothetical protein